MSLVPCCTSIKHTTSHTQQHKTNENTTGATKMKERSVVAVSCGIAALTLLGVQGTMWPLAICNSERND